MMQVLELVAGAILSLMTIGTAGIGIWKITVSIRDNFETTENTACKVTLLEKKILRALQDIKNKSLQDSVRVDRRFDAIEKKINYLYGRTKTTIPPRD